MVFSIRGRTEEYKEFMIVAYSEYHIVANFSQVSPPKDHSNKNGKHLKFKNNRLNLADCQF